MCQPSSRTQGRCASGAGRPAQLQGTGFLLGSQRGEGFNTRYERAPAGLGQGDDG